MDILCVGRGEKAYYHEVCVNGIRREVQVGIQGSSQVQRLGSLGGLEHQHVCPLVDLLLVQWPCYQVRYIMAVTFHILTPYRCMQVERKEWYPFACT